MFKITIPASAEGRKLVLDGLNLLNSSTVYRAELKISWHSNESDFIDLTLHHDAVTLRVNDLSPICFTHIEFGEYVQFVPMHRVVKRSEISNVWYITSIADTPYFLSYDDADHYLKTISIEDPDIDYFGAVEMGDCTEQTRLPLTGKMWFAGDQFFGAKYQAQELGLDPTLVQVEVDPFN